MSSMQPDGDYENFLRKEKCRYLHISKNDRILDIGGGDGSVWDYVEVPEQTAMWLVEPDEQLAQVAAQKGHYYGQSRWLDDVPWGIETFTKVLCLGLLEHLDDPYNMILKKLDGASFIYITVPNGESFHRIVGVEAGMIMEETELGPQDLAISHKRVYTIDSLKRLIDRFILNAKNAYNVEYKTTSFKFTNSSEMMQFEDRIDALNRAAIRAGISGDGRHGAEIVAILTRKGFSQ